MYNNTISIRKVLCLVLVLASTAGRIAAEEVKRNEIYHRTLQGTVWVLQSNGKGSGWVVDRAQRLVVTNFHVVQNDEVVGVVFPALKDGKVIAERSYYQEKARPIRAKVLDYDKRRDLALIQLESLPDNVAELKLAAESPGPGDSVHSIGNPGRSGALWIYTSGTVRAVYNKEWRAQLPGTNEVLKLAARVVETQAPTNPGDSGGPVVNDKGELVAVTQGGNSQASLMNYAIDASEVRTFVKEVCELMTPKTAEQFNRRGVRYHNRRHYDEAISDYTQAIRLDSTLARAFKNRAAAFNCKGDRDTAIADCNEAIRLNSNMDDAYNERGIAFSWKDQYDKAIENYTRAIQLDPKEAVYHTNRGQAYSSKGDWNQAIGNYDEAVRLNVDYALPRLKRGHAYFQLKNYSQAVADYDATLKLTPLDPKVHNFLGNALVPQKKFQEAFNAYTEALKLGHPEPAIVLDNRGDVFFHVKNYDKAIADYSAAIKINPRYATAYFDRGAAHEEKGEYNEAQEDFDKAVQLDPKLAEKAKVQDRKFLRVVNKTGEPIRVFVQYETLTTENRWLWYPTNANKGESVWWDFASGDGARLAHDKWTIKARRVRVWAEGKRTGNTWTRNKSVDLILVPDKGYRARGILTHTITFE
jgi:tetratricopeptide (TPR) repeat protein